MNNDPRERSPHGGFSPYGLPQPTTGFGAPSMLSQRGMQLAQGPLDRGRDFLGKVGGFVTKNPETTMQGLGILAQMYGAKKDRDLYEEDREYEKELTEEQRRYEAEDRAREQARRESLSPYFESLDRLFAEGGR